MYIYMYVCIYILYQHVDIYMNTNMWVYICIYVMVFACVLHLCMGAYVFRGMYIQRYHCVLQNFRICKYCYFREIVCGSVKESACTKIWPLPLATVVIVIAVALHTRAINMIQRGWRSHGFPTTTPCLPNNKQSNAHECRVVIGQYRIGVPVTRVTGERQRAREREKVPRESETFVPRGKRELKRGRAALK